MLFAESKTSWEFFWPMKKINFLWQIHYVFIMLEQALRENICCALMYLSKSKKHGKKCADKMPNNHRTGARCSTDAKIVRASENKLFCTYLNRINALFQWSIKFSQSESEKIFLSKKPRLKVFFNFVLHTQRTKTII